MVQETIYVPKHKLRFVTASSLFDGHDASINVMRRILQASGAEVIHLGHNRSVDEVVGAAIQEDVQGIAISSYQGGHMEYFKYMVDLLRERGAGHIRVFGGGGGVIIPPEMKELHEYGIARIFSPEDGRKYGLQGMINQMLELADFSTLTPEEDAELEKECDLEQLHVQAKRSVAQLITLAEEVVDGKSPAFLGKTALDVLTELRAKAKQKKGLAPILGITGTGGAGKSSLTDELVRRFLEHFPDKHLAIISIDPSKQKTGGALLGDRIRMNAIHNPRVYMRSLATRKSRTELSAAIADAIHVVQAAGFDFIIVETSGIGQGDAEIIEISDLSMYVMTSEFGAPSQLEKIDMLDYADLIVINKFDRKGSEDALRDVRKQYQRNHMLFEARPEELPVFGTMASQFHDPGTNQLFTALIRKINEKCELGWSLPSFTSQDISKKSTIIPGERAQYLGDIVQTMKQYKEFMSEQVEIARKLYQIKGTKEAYRQWRNVEAQVAESEKWAEQLHTLEKYYADQLHPESKKKLEEWPQVKAAYAQDEFVTKIRDKEIRTVLYTESLAGTRIPKVSLPSYEDWEIF